MFQRDTIQRLVASRRFEWAIVAVIIANAITLGLETYPSVYDAHGPLLLLLDKTFLAIFVAELLLKLYAYRTGFFKSGWNIFDLVIVAIALVPTSGTFAVLRALRILRVLRLISVVPALRRVVDAFVHSLSGLMSVAGILGVVFYVGAVMTTKLFGAAFPAFFGSIERSLFSLFQIMTLESWSMGIVRPVMDVYPYAWLFFVPFVLITTFAVLNLLIGIVVNSMQEIHEREQRSMREELSSNTHATLELEHKLEEMESLLEEIRGIVATAPNRDVHK